MNKLALQYLQDLEMFEDYNIVRISKFQFNFDANIVLVMLYIAACDMICMIRFQRDLARYSCILCQLRKLALKFSKQNKD